jgi:hypothetical protein
VEKLDLRIPGHRDYLRRFGIVAVMVSTEQARLARDPSVAVSPEHFEQGHEIMREFLNRQQANAPSGFCPARAPMLCELNFVDTEPRDLLRISMSWERDDATLATSVCAL